MVARTLTTLAADGRGCGWVWRGLRDDPGLVAEAPPNPFYMSVHSRSTRYGDIDQLRLVAWNANCAIRKHRSSEEVLALLDPLNADILVVSEGPANPEGAAWSWGEDASAKLAVWTRNGYSAAVIQSDVAIPQSALLQVRGPVAFALAAVWPVEQGRLTYGGILRRVVDTYLPDETVTRTILAGDLNSNTRVVAQRASHPKLVSSLSVRGLNSVYHHQEYVPHGDERTGTYRTGSREFYLDYAFVPLSWIESATAAVLRGPQWSLMSDHYPLVLDIPDAAFRRAAP